MNRPLRAPAAGTLALPLVLLSALSGAPRLEAGTGGSARALGLAGAYTVRARGTDAPAWNPANLALPGNPRLSFDLVSFSAMAASNTVDLSLYNRINGAVLDESDKEAILSRMPGGFAAASEATVSAAGVQWNRFAFRACGDAAARADLPRSLFELLLEGNAVVDSALFDDAAGEGRGLASIGVSGATTVLRRPDLVLHAGATARYLFGLGYARLTRMSGVLVTDERGITGEGFATVSNGTWGSGFGIDAGLAAELPGNLTLGLFLENVWARVRITAGVEEHEYEIRLDTLTIESLSDADEEGDAEDLVHDTETVREPGSLTYSLPRRMVLGAGKPLAGGSIEIDLAVSFSDGAGYERSPRIAAGWERPVRSWLTARTGLALGAIRGNTSSAGATFRLGGFALDLAAASLGSFWPGHLRGAELALGMRLVF